MDILGLWWNLSGLKLKKKEKKLVQTWNGGLCVSAECYPSDSKSYSIVSFESFFFFVFLGKELFKNTLSEDFSDFMALFRLFSRLYGFILNFQFSSEPEDTQY